MSLGTLGQVNFLNLFGFGSVAFLDRTFLKFGVKYCRKKYIIHIKNVEFEFQKVTHCYIDGPI